MTAFALRSTRRQCSLPYFNVRFGEHAYHRAANATARRRCTVHSHICERGGQIRGDARETDHACLYLTLSSGSSSRSRRFLCSLAEVIAKIDAVGDRIASEEHEKHPDAIPAHSEKPSQTVNPGLVTIDGLRLEFLRLQLAETENALNDCVAGPRDSDRSGFSLSRGPRFSWRACFRHLDPDAARVQNASIRSITSEAAPQTSKI
jgi:hypothetical protein